ncbi:hypothetical protein Cgig2_022585 [Carnegiea gigantea]|uniref:Pescadillo homolog n=1 Tax=Carnegiea gigantea TaxID=171969 RepID=A0A9Q1QM22_9CARY|nr:hypothetical protein Cgig2_022585 [Carnegiea gigantea]
MPKHYRPAGKKKEGNAAKYITRSQAVKQLQVSLPIFRKLCILKGVFPREPKKKVKGNHQTYYHTKDIAFVQHDPILEKIRQQRTHEKKVKKAVSKKNKDRVQRLKARKPKYILDRLILERYPRFVDALGDLDDCLTMVHLFAALPTLQNEKVTVKRIQNCRRLSHEWQAYIVRTHKLRKNFISVKGIYYQVLCFVLHISNVKVFSIFHVHLRLCPECIWTLSFSETRVQAEVEGQKITWVTPHALQQVLTDDVDFNVMLTFLEFYEALLAHVNNNLYHSINVKYPPILDPRLEALAADLYLLSRFVSHKSGASNMLLQDQTGQLDESQLTLAQLQHQLIPSEPGTLMQLVEETEVNNDDDDDDETKECKSLFRNMKFFLSREVPREALLFVISAFGGMVSWEGDGAPFDETDQSITHQVVDRPSQGHMFLSREYIQPQWVFDCVNARLILPTEDYLVGKIPPPHLSPFVDNEAVGYIPDYAEKIKQLKAAARRQVIPVPDVGTDVNDTQNVLLEGVASRVEAKEAAERKQEMLLLEKQYHDELKMELQRIGNASSAPQLGSVGHVEATDDGQSKRDQTARDSDELDKLLMSRSKRGLLNAIEIRSKQKNDEIEVLKARKRRNLESGGSGKD